jgi:hypothetical protein
MALADPDSKPTAAPATGAAPKHANQAYSAALIPALLAILVLAAAHSALMAPGYGGSASAAETEKHPWLLRSSPFNFETTLIASRMFDPAALVNGGACSTLAQPADCRDKSLQVAAAEGRTRIAWYGGMLLAWVAAAAISLVCFGLIYTTFVQHHRSKRAISYALTMRAAPARIPWQRLAGAETLSSLGILGYAVISGAGIGIVFLVLSVLFDLLTGVDPGSILQPFPEDQLMAWVAKHAFVNVGTLASITTWLILGAATFVTTLVTTALLISPANDKLIEDATLKINDPAIVAVRRLIGRGFDRVRLALFLGAILLVCTLGEVSARYAWAATYGPMKDGDITKAPLYAYGQQYVTEVGIFFTAFLAALYFPAVLLLRWRARHLYSAKQDQLLAKSPGSTLPPADYKNTWKDQETFLSGEGLDFTIGKGFTDLAAVFAPTALSAFGKAAAVFIGS